MHPKHSERINGDSLVHEGPAFAQNNTESNNVSVPYYVDCLRADDSIDILRFILKPMEGGANLH